MLKKARQGSMLYIASQQAKICIVALQALTRCPLAILEKYHAKRHEEELGLQIEVIKVTKLRVHYLASGAPRGGVCSRISCGECKQQVADCEHMAAVHLGFRDLSTDSRGAPNTS